MSGIREKVTYANVMATIAVFIALGAGAYAAGLPKDSVKSKQIKAGAVKNAELAYDAVTSDRVKDGSLLGADFAAGQLPSGPQGPQGATGAQGPNGDRGIQGPAGPTLGAIRDGGTPPTAEAIYAPGISIDMPVAGHLFVTADIESLNPGCNPASAADVGLYVDNGPTTGNAIPIPATDRRFSSGAARNYNVSGVSPSLSAGGHAVLIGTACDGASTPTTLSQNLPGSVTAVMLGG